MNHSIPAAKNAPQALVVAAFTSLYILWGSTYIAIAIALKTLTPFLLAASRFTIAGLLLFGWCLVRGQRLPPLRSVANSAVAGILMLFFGTGGLVWAEQYIPSGVAAIIIATVPLCFVALDKRQWRFHFSNPYIIGGLLVGFAGVLTLFADKDSGTGSNSKLVIIACAELLVGSLLWAAGSLYSKYTISEGSTAMKASIQMMAAGFLSFIPAFVTGEVHAFAWSQVTSSTIMAILYLVTFGSLVGYISYVWLLGVRPPALVGTYAYVNPVVAVFLGWLIMNEKITMRQIVALAIILAGVITVNFSKEKKRNR